VVMSNDEPQWALPESGAPSRGSQQFVASMSLGGVTPEVVEPARTSDFRELLLVALLLVASLVAGAASLMSWRDYGIRLDPSVAESGWVQADGSIGRGWAAVAIAVVLAVAGILIAVHHQEVGRRVAVAGGVGLVMMSIVEFGLGAGKLRTGPGNGLWVEMVVGVLVVIAVGVLGPADVPEADERSPL